MILFLAGKFPLYGLVPGGYSVSSAPPVSSTFLASGRFDEG
jgi:hypothetical protein